MYYKRIRDLREDKDLTQKQLAEYLNVSQNLILVTNEEKEPSIQRFYPNSQHFMKPLLIT